MAKQKGKVYLGYEDELIRDKNQTLLLYKRNKIGGLPDWPPLENLKFNPKCPLCGLHRLLIVQCYAPLENSVYHRTLYIFACINPNCWTQSESWLCVRSQYLDKSGLETPTVVAMPVSDTNLTWCNGADEWDINDNSDSANGNIMNIDNASGPNNQRNSDDDESNSIELETVEQAFGNLQVFDAHNANTSPIQGAVGAIGVPVADAEIEEGGDDPGLVIVDAPLKPTYDLEALLQLPDELPADLRNHLICGPLQFIPKYIYVEEEWSNSPNTDEKVNELLTRYRRDNDIESSDGGGGGGGGDKIGGPAGAGDDETYEEAVPLHGDKLFHAFLVRLQKNPGHILRYSREEPPILGAPLPYAAGTPESPTVPAACIRCGSKLISELQLVPAFAETLTICTTIPLKHLHFLSVIIFTCSQSCWQPTDTLIPEHVVFQPEVI